MQDLFGGLAGLRLLENQLLQLLDVAPALRRLAGLQRDDAPGEGLAHPGAQVIDEQQVSLHALPLSPADGLASTRTADRPVRPLACVGQRVREESAKARPSDFRSFFSAQGNGLPRA